MKGFTAIKKGESPGLFTRVLVKRFARRVKAGRRVFIYDNNCNLHKGGCNIKPWDQLCIGMSGIRLFVTFFLGGGGQSFKGVNIVFTV